MTTAQKISLGLMGANMFMGSKKPAGQDPSKLGAEAQAASDKLLAQFNSGALTPIDAGNIDQWHSQTVASRKQYYANAGLSDSTMAQQDMAQIGVQAEGMKQQALQNYLTQGLNAAGIANGPMQAAINQQIAQDQAAQQAQAQFLQTLAMMSVGQSSSGHS